MARQTLVKLSTDSLKQVQENYPLKPYSRFFLLYEEHIQNDLFQCEIQYHLKSVLQA